MTKKTGIFWLDLETSGLSPLHDDILEIAYLFTDMQGSQLMLPYTTLVTPDDPERFFNYIYDEENQYIRAMHTKNNLFRDMFSGEVEVRTHHDIEGFLHKSFAEVKEMTGIESWYLGGSSVHFDRSFLEEKFLNMPQGLSHRHVDMTSIRVATGNMNMKTDIAHRALQDILEDVRQYKEIINQVQGR